MDAVLSINLITSNPKVRSGRPCIAGTGLRVTDVVISAVFHLQTPDEIAAGYGISLADVYAALAYYYEHKSELDGDVRELITTAKLVKEQYLANFGPSVLS